MSLAVGRHLRETRQRAATARSLAVRVLFGTESGVAVFLGTVVFVGLLWRIGVFITDTYTLANALASLDQGRLVVDDAVYGGGLDTPGMVTHEGSYYGRNYGQLVLALPVLWTLEALATVADPGVLFAAGWSLLLVAFGGQVGRVLGRPSLGTTAGATCGLLAFLANVAVARPFADRLLLLAALQLTAVLATAFAATTLYRLLERVHGRRTAVVAAVGLVGATPVGFWAAIPKRHVYTIALFLGICYAFYRSRPHDGDGEGLLGPLGFRASAYALVGLTTWLHPGEGFVFFLALVAVDLPTARSNDPRSLAVVGAVFALSLVPFLITNALISGDPLRPPRLLGGFKDPAGGSAAPGGEQGTGAGGVVAVLVTSVAPPALAEPVLTGLSRWRTATAPVAKGLVTLVERPEALYRSVVRGGYIGAHAVENDFETTDLTLLEAGPVVAAVVAPAVTALGRLVGVDRSRFAGLPTGAGSATDAARRGLRAARHRLRDPVVATDALVVLAGTLFFLTYIQQLPTHAQVTARYLLLLYAVAVYGLARQRPLRRALRTHGRTALWAWSAGVLLGAQAFVLVVALGSLGLGEAVQVHALVGLAGAGPLALAAGTTAVTDRFDRATALLLGLTAALGTDFLLLAGLVYFQYGQYALPAVGELARLLSLV